jgi:hypothetical protein
MKSAGAMAGRPLAVKLREWLGKAPEEPFTTSAI